MAQLYIDNAKKLKVRIDNNQKIVDTVEAAGGFETTLTPVSYTHLTLPTIYSV